MKALLRSLLLSLAIAPVAMAQTAPMAPDMQVYISTECPHCEVLQVWLHESFAGDYPDVTITVQNISESMESAQQLIDELAVFGVQLRGVPVVIMGDAMIVGINEKEWAETVLRVYGAPRPAMAQTTTMQTVTHTNTVRTQVPQMQTQTQMEVPMAKVVPMAPPTPSINDMRSSARNDTRRARQIIQYQRTAAVQQSVATPSIVRPVAHRALTTMSQTPTEQPRLTREIMRQPQVKAAFIAQLKELDNKPVFDWQTAQFR